MKKTNIIILGLLVAAMVCVAAFFFVPALMRANDPTSLPSQEEVAQADGQKTAPILVDLYDVGIPDSLASQVKDYEGFRLSYNKERRTPNYVVWELLGSETSGESGRSNNFWQDEEIEGCTSWADYRGTGYDRGHMCPSADQKWSQKAMEDCFVMANICPQAGDLNRKAWNTLENKERVWAQRDSAIWIVAGPIYEATDRQTMGDTGIRIPGAFFKVIAAPFLPEPRAIGFVYPNMEAPGNMQNYAMTVDEVEQITGYDFFRQLPTEIQEKMESVTSFKEWNRR